MGKDDLDNFENLFEPFALENEGATETVEQPQQEQQVVQLQAIYCSSCGATNDAENRHCEACGARLTRSQMPVAPKPMMRTTAGARAVIVLASIVLGVTILAVIVNVFRDGGETVADSSTTTVTSLATVPIGELVPIRVDCTSELPAFPCSALIDDDETNSYNAREGGVDTELTFLFSPPVQITEMFIQNLEEEERFLRNARMRGIEVLIDDLPQATVVDLDDTQDSQRIQIRSLRTSSLTIRMTSAYPGQSFEGREPFPELAIQEITFFGRASPEVQN